MTVRLLAICMQKPRLSTNRNCSTVSAPAGSGGMSRVYFVFSPSHEPRASANRVVCRRASPPRIWAASAAHPRRGSAALDVETLEIRRHPRGARVVRPQERRRGERTVARHDVLGALPERRSQLKRAVGPDVVGAPGQVHALDERRTEHHTDRGRLDSDCLTHDVEPGDGKAAVVDTATLEILGGPRGDGRRLTPDTAVVSIERGAAPEVGRCRPSPSARLHSTAFPGRPCRAGCRARRRAPGRSRPNHLRARAGTTPGRQCRRKVETRHGRDQQRDQAQECDHERSPSVEASEAQGLLACREPALRAHAADFDARPRRDRADDPYRDPSESRARLRRCVEGGDHEPDRDERDREPRLEPSPEDGDEHESQREDQPERRERRARRASCGDLHDEKPDERERDPRASSARARDA